MSEAVLPATETRLSGGAMLRQAREAAGLHIGALAVSLRVPVKKLEALEADSSGVKVNASVRRKTLRFLNHMDD